MVAGELGRNPVFHNTPHCPQAPARQQVAIALDRLGNYCNRAFVSRSQKLWGVGKGTCDLYMALGLHTISSIESQHVRWPTPAGRLTM